MENMMRAVVYREKGCFALEERPVPEILDPRDAVVRVTLTSICSSDLHIKGGFVPRAKPGIIVGHEMVGVVEQVGPQVTRVAPGDRVAVNVETFCGTCFFCQRGAVNNCTDPAGGWALGCRIDGGTGGVCPGALRGQRFDPDPGWRHRPPGPVHRRHPFHRLLGGPAW